ncbi:MAG: D-aminoacyl-tRNA deacylase [Edaphocola sp.]
MRAVLQRVSGASVSIGGKRKAVIGKGLLVLLGIEAADTGIDVDWLARKITQMRIFGDADGKMNLSLTDIGGELLLVSQFTLHAATQKGNRPSFIKAARPEQAMPLYQLMRATLVSLLQKPIATGEFGADMQVSLVNDGPVTIIIDSQQPG